jgi:hypothetical protein
METKRFGVIEAPEGLVLRKGETIEWVITYREIGQSLGIDSKTHIAHADTSEAAIKGWIKDNPSTRIERVEYYGTYQY